MRGAHMRAHGSTHSHDPYSAPGTHNPNSALQLDDPLQEKGGTRNNLKPDRVDYQASLETALQRPLSDVVLGHKQKRRCGWVHLVKASPPM